MSVDMKIIMLGISTILNGLMILSLLRSQRRIAEGMTKITKVMVDMGEADRRRISDDSWL